MADTNLQKLNSLGYALYILILKHEAILNQYPGLSMQFTNLLNEVNHVAELIEKENKDVQKTCNNCNWQDFNSDFFKCDCENTSNRSEINCDSWELSELPRT